MANEKQRAWIRDATNAELEEAYAQGPTAELAHGFMFELDRRKLERQDRISRRSMWAGAAGALAAVASAFVATVQLISPTDRELAESEVMRRGLVTMSKRCSEQLFDFAISKRMPELPEEPSKRQLALDTKLDRLSTSIWELHINASKQWSTNLSSLLTVVARSALELERERTLATLCLQQAEQLMKSYTQTEEELQISLCGE